MNLSPHDTESIINTIWLALEGYREDCIPEGMDKNDNQWNDICTAMAWLEESLEGTK